MVHTTGPGPSLQEGPDGEARYCLVPGEDAKGVPMRLERVLSPERLSGLNLPTGVITLPPVDLDEEESD